MPKQNKFEDLFQACLMFASKARLEQPVIALCELIVKHRIDK